MRRTVAQIPFVLISVLVLSACDPLPSGPKMPSSDLSGKLREAARALPLPISVKDGEPLVSGEPPVSTCDIRGSGGFAILGYEVCRAAEDAAYDISGDRPEGPDKSAAEAIALEQYRQRAEAIADGLAPDIESLIDDLMSRRINNPSGMAGDLGRIASPETWTGTDFICHPDDEEFGTSGHEDVARSACTWLLRQLGDNLVDLADGKFVPTADFEVIHKRLKGDCRTNSGCMYGAWYANQLALKYPELTSTTEGRAMSNELQRCLDKYISAYSDVE